METTMHEPVMQPLTAHDKRIARDTVHRKLRLTEVDLVLAWSQELMALRPLTEEEQALRDLLWAQHCALYVDRVTASLLEQQHNRKEDRERIRESSQSE